MKRAISVHRRDFAAITILIVLAFATVAFILVHQPAFTLGQSYYTVRADFPTAAAVTAGQGQSVTIAGVEVGLIGGVQLRGGHAVVTMNLFKRYAPIYRNATVLLRPRTPLKDMYLALDPGTRSAGAIPDNGVLSEVSTQPDVDVDQILGSLDADTRTYLLLLLSGGAQAFQRATGGSSELPDAASVAALRGVFKRFAPLDRDTRSFTTLLAQRNLALRSGIHDLQQVVTTLGGVDGQLASLVRASNTNFSAIASQQAALESGLTLLPGTLAQTSTTLRKVRAFAAASGNALHQTLPFAHELGPALAAARPLLTDTVTPIRTQLRPFAVAVQPLARTLRPAAAELATATPRLTRAVGVFNALFNTLAHQPGAGQQSYLFWGSWLSHIAADLTAGQDANGSIVRGIFMSNCSELNLLEVSVAKADPSIPPLLALLGAPDWSTIKSSFCPAAAP